MSPPMTIAPSRANNSAISCPMPRAAPVTSAILSFNRIANFSGRRCRLLLQPRIAAGVLAGVIRIEIDEAALDLPVADLEHVAPPAGAGLGHPGPPRAVAVLAVAGALADDHVARDHPVEVRVVVRDRLERAADVAEEPADLVAAVGDSPLGEVHLRIDGEQVEDAAAGRGRPAVVERLEVLQRH